MDQLILKGLKFRGFHGYFDQEKKEGNDFEIDLTFTLSLQRPAVSDELAHTIDYAKARDIVAEIMNGPSKNLIEHLALHIGEKLYNSFIAEELEVRLRKLNPPMDGETAYSEVVLSWPR